MGKRVNGSYPGILASDDPLGGVLER